MQNIEVAIALIDYKQNCPSVGGRIQKMPQNSSIEQLFVIIVFAIYEEIKAVVSKAEGISSCFVLGPSEWPIKRRPVGCHHFWRGTDPRL